MNAAADAMRKRFNEISQTQPVVTGWPTDLPFSRETIQQVHRSGYDMYLEGVPILPEPDEDDWREIGGIEHKNRPEYDRVEDLKKYRALCELNPYCKRALKLYKMYVFGPDFMPMLEPRDENMSREDRIKVQMAASTIWEEFLDLNADGWSPEEHGKRAWREGDAITRVFEQGDELIARFIDPELVNDPEHPEWYGIRTKEGDACTREEYLISKDGDKVDDRVSATDIYHTRLDADAVEPRGQSRFKPVIKPSKFIDALIETETYHRQIQASIVLIRRVAGGAGSAQILLDNTKTATRQYNDGTTMSLQKIRKGSIPIVPKGVELEFAQPKSDFSDASPLVNMLIRQVSVATGWPFSMLSADSSEGTLASELANESPVGQLVTDERRTFSRPLKAIFKRALAMRIKDIEGFSSIEELMKVFKVEMMYGMNAQRDPLKFVQSLSQAVMNGGISRREYSRALGKDPDKMRAEIQEETESGIYAATGTQMPTGADRAQSAKDNATKGAGGNQGGPQSVSHTDSKEVKV